VSDLSRYVIADPWIVLVVLALVGAFLCAAWAEYR
jgi:hypothetical protein